MPAFYNNGTSRPSSLLSRTFLLLFGTTVGFLIVEVAARILWTAPWYEQLLNEQWRNQARQYTRNSLGLRDREYAVPKPAGCERILILGDSFTFGGGVTNDEAIFPEILERRLNDMDLFPDSVEVLNAGIPGSLTGDWVDLWEEVAPQFEPDVVLIVFFLRDGTLTGSIPEFFGRIRTEIVNRNSKSMLYRYFYIFRLLRDYRDRLAIDKLYTAHFHLSYFGNKDDSAEWIRAQNNLLRLRDLSEKVSAKVGLVIFPILAELHENYPFQEICYLLESFGRDNSFAVHSLLPAFMGLNAPELWVSAMDQHPNERGHAIAANSLLPFVIKLLSEVDAR